MPRGYMEGPVGEEREAALERGDHLPREPVRERLAVLGSTPEQPEQHFIGWANEVDADALFAAGEAWGIALVRRPG
jgi:hypothetical protein